MAPPIEPELDGEVGLATDQGRRLGGQRRRRLRHASIVATGEEAKVSTGNNVRYPAIMVWEVEYTDEFGAWFDTLTPTERRTVFAAVDRLEEVGPTLGRPDVDTLRASRHANMKELRPRGGNIRILFAFDPRRTAILLLGGDKTGQWQAWYERAIPLADRLYDEYLEELRREGLLP